MVTIRREVPGRGTWEVEWCSGQLRLRGWNAQGAKVDADSVIMALMTGYSEVSKLAGRASYVTMAHGVEVA